MLPLAAIPDPRRFPDVRDALPEAAALYAQAERSLAAGTPGESLLLDEGLRDTLATKLRLDGDALAAILAGAPSVSVYRHLWRQLDAAWRVATMHESTGVSATVFALPVVIVVASIAPDSDGSLPGVLGAPDTLAAILREHGALAGNETFALGNALVAADAIDIARLPEILEWQRLPDWGNADSASRDRTLEPAPLTFGPAHESVHLRFVVGSSIASMETDLLADTSVGRWGMPLASELSRQLKSGGASVLALPRAPQRPLRAVWQGRVAHREVGAQIFASSAIRKLRASTGEPSAVISAHRAPDAQHGGELRLSLSSPFEARDAEGFRCPLFPQDRIADVVAMLLDLLQDCRVADIRTLDGVHADRDAATGLRLLFKPDTIPAGNGASLH